MLDLFNIHQGQFETFLLIWLRTSTMLYVFPVFQAQQIPTLVRIGLGMLVSFVLFHAVPTMHPLPDLGALVVAAVSQVVLGLIVGFVAYLVFMGIQYAGEILDTQIGFAIANVINPATQQQVSVIGELELTLATLLFLITNSHLLFLEGIGGSFHLVPLPYINMDPVLVGGVVSIMQQAFLVILKIAAPPAVALFMVNIGLGLMSKVAPQMNVFVVGFPLQIGVGLMMMAVSVPLLGYVAPQLFNQTAHQMDAVMRALAVH